MSIPGKAKVEARIYDLWFSYTIQVIADPTPVSEVEKDGIKVWGYSGTLFIENAEGKKISIYDLSGHLIKTSKCNSARFTMPMNSGGWYLVRIGSNNWKISL